MKAYVTGITGTVAPYIKEELIIHGYDVYDKHFRVESDDQLHELKKYLDEINPDVIFHLALGPFSVVELLSKYCETNSKSMVYISTVSVFEDNDGGPYTKDTVVTVTNNYGKYKYDCENIVKELCPNSHIIRIGWQISRELDKTSNNMFNFIFNNLNDNNEIVLSDKFYPSTSFLDDTARAVVDIYLKMNPDLYLVNSNKWQSLYEIVEMLNKRYNLNITVIKDSSFSRNDIMIDERVEIGEL